MGKPQDRLESQLGSGREFMSLQRLDLSSIVGQARDFELACKVVIFTPLVYWGLRPVLGLDYPPGEMLGNALLTTYICLAFVVWHGWRRRAVDVPTCLALGAFWFVNVVLLLVFGLPDDLDGRVILAASAGAVSIPLLLVLVRTLLRRRSRLRSLARSCLRQQRFAPRPPLRDTGRRSFWRYLESVAAFVAGVYWTWLVGEFFERDGSRFLANNGVGTLMQYGLTIPFFLYAFKCYRSAGQLRALSIEEAAGRDQRAPILFLRSFVDDTIRVRSTPIVLPRHLPGETPALDAGFWGRLVRFEEVLARALWQIGPVVAIGAPGEELPSPGAIRSYYDDAAWQSEVIALMQRARLVFIVPSRHKWLQWEIETLRRLGLADKGIFMLPPGPAATQSERWEIVAKAMGSCDGDTALPVDPACAAVVLRHKLGLTLAGTDLDETGLTILAKGAAHFASHPLD